MSDVYTLTEARRLTDSYSVPEPMRFLETVAALERACRERDEARAAQGGDVKVFHYGQPVRVKLPKKRAFVGRYYSTYRPFPNSERRICVERPAGAGVAYLLRYCTPLKEEP